MRNILFAIIILAGFIFVFYNLSEVQDIADTFQRGNWIYLLLAAAIEALWLLNVALSYKVIYQAIGLQEKFKRLGLLVSSAYFLNVVAPTAGLGGTAILVTDARRRGHSPARAAVAGVLVVLFDYLAFLVVLLVGLIVLFRRKNLSPVELGASGFLFLLACSLAVLLYLGMRSGELLGRVLARMVRWVNRLLRPFMHRAYLSEQRAVMFAYDAALGLQRLRQRPKDLIIPFLSALSSKTLLIIILYLMFLAFDVPHSPGTIIAGFSIGYLFYIVSPTPAGIGFVESALTLGLKSLNVPLGSATVITLAYRGITYWLPLLIGMISFRIVSLEQKEIILE